MTAAGPGPRDDGLATVVGAGLVAVLLTVAVAGVHLGTATVTRHRAEAAADLAALAAAGRAVAGTETACGQARRITGTMRGRLAGCQVQGWDVLIEVEADPPGPLGRFGTARAAARAGPVAP